MKYYFLLFSTIISSSAFAGLPPTTTKGQSDSGKTTTFNLEAPYSQMTETASVTRLIETGNNNLLVNPSFEASSVLSGWTAGSGTGCGANTTNFSHGKQGYSCSNFNTVATVLEQCVTPAVEVSGRTLLVSMDVSSVTAGFEVCSVVNSSETTCVAVPTSGNFATIPIPLTAANGVPICVRLKSTNTNNKAYRADNAFLGMSPSNQSDVTSPVLSGSYTPTITAVANVQAVSNIQTSIYSRVGNIVTVSGGVQIDPTSGSGTATNVTISVPIMGENDISLCHGVITSRITNTQAGTIEKNNGDAGNLCRVNFPARDTNNRNFVYMFQYRIE